jgi:hypothetical protein
VRFFKLADDFVTESNEKYIFYFTTTSDWPTHNRKYRKNNVTKATKADGIDSLESIPRSLKRLKIPSQVSTVYNWRLSERTITMHRSCKRYSHANKWKHLRVHQWESVSNVQLYIYRYILYTIHTVLKYW